jgi:hypothetical protein
VAIKPIETIVTKTSSTVNCSLHAPTTDTFLKRPVKLFTATWTSGETIGDNLKVFYPLLDWYNDRNIKNYLRNAALIIPKVFKLQFRSNATIQHYGALIATYYPSAEDFDVNFGASQLFQLPKVLIKPTRKQVFEIEIPFISQFAAIPLEPHHLHDYLKSQLTVLVPLQMSNGTTVPIDISVFAVMEDFELVGINPLQDIPHSVVSPEGFDTDPSGSRPYKAEQQQQSSSDNSSSSKLVTDIVDIASSAWNAVTGIGEGISSIASLFFSSPPTEQENKPYQAFPLRMGQIDGPVGSYLLGPSQNALLDVSDESVNSCSNESTLSNFASREGLLGIVNVTQDLGPGTPLFFQAITPTMFFYDSLGSQVAPSTRVLATPAGYISRFFEYWKGGFNLRITPVMSSFHSLRLRFSYFPYPNFTGSFNIGSLTDDMAAMTYNVIVDMNTDAGFDFVLPYVAYKDFLNQLQTGDRVDENTCSGFFVCTIVNSLISNDTVVSPIQLMVTLSACNDFQLSLPSLRGFQTLTPVLPASVVVSPEGFMTEEADGNTSFVVASDEGKKIENGYNSVSIMTNLLQLIKIPQTMLIDTLTTANVRLYFNIFGTWTFPGTEEASATYLQHILPLFRFMKGSSRVIVHTSGMAPNVPISVIKIDPYSAVLYNVAASETPIDDMSNFNTSGQLNFPYYALYPTRDFLIDVTTPYDSPLKCMRFRPYATHKNNLPQTPAVNLSGIGTQFCLSACAGDDFQLGFQMPCPVLMSR